MYYLYTFLVIFCIYCGVVSQETIKEPTIFGNSTETVYVVEGQEAKLRCYVGGNPPPMVWWTFNGISIPGTKCSENGYCLPIPNATTDNFGTYSCNADNGVGENQRQDMHLLVWSAPRIKMQRAKVTLALGDEIRLRCPVCGYPLIAPYWSKSAEKLYTNSEQNQEIKSHPSGSNCTVSELYIKKAEKHNFGTYNCHARNKYGSDKSSVTLDEVKDPVCSPPACLPATHTPVKSAASIVSIFYCIVLVLPLMHVWLNLSGN